MYVHMCLFVCTYICIVYTGVPVLFWKWASTGCVPCSSLAFWGVHLCGTRVERQLGVAEQLTLCPTSLNSQPAFLLLLSFLWCLATSPELWCNLRLSGWCGCRCRLLVEQSTVYYHFREGDSTLSAPCAKLPLLHVSLLHARTSATVCIGSCFKCSRLLYMRRARVVYG